MKLEGRFLCALVAAVAVACSGRSQVNSSPENLGADGSADSEQIFTDSAVPVDSSASDSLGDETLVEAGDDALLTDAGDEVTDETPSLVDDASDTAVDDTVWVDTSLEAGSDDAAYEASAVDAAVGDITDAGESDTVHVDSAPVDPCTQAAIDKSYVGCDYWPTVTSNIYLKDGFDFAAVVANAGSTTAKIKVTGPGLGAPILTSVAPNALVRIVLPWQKDLLQAETSVKVAKAAFHLVSDQPVTVYQFNPIQYQNSLKAYSYTNDASLLLPTTAMTGTYRITGQHAWSFKIYNVGAFTAVTGTADGTDVTLKLPTQGDITPGPGIGGAGLGTTFKFKLNAGEVAELITSNLSDTYDMSGGLLTATKPVQVITGVSCIYEPEGFMACDHNEESVFPASALGKSYVVETPTGPYGAQPGHMVRMYGNFDSTTLTYDPAPPPGAPAVLMAGQVVEFGPTTIDFYVSGNNSFGVGSFLLGSEIVDKGGPGEGDPSESMMVPVGQYRNKYIFLAPRDYDYSWADVEVPAGASVKLDGVAVTTTPTAVGSSGYGVLRLKLGPGKDGAHVLTATKPVGIQVIGYGLYTSYQYPGGLDLKAISPNPI